MTDHDELGSGEIRRGFDRLEKQIEAMQQDVSRRYHSLSDKMTTALGPIGELRVHLENAQKDVDRIATTQRGLVNRVGQIEIRAAAVAGGVTAAVFLVKFLIGK